MERERGYPRGLYIKDTDNSRDATDDEWQGGYYGYRRSSGKEPLEAERMDTMRNRMEKLLTGSLGVIRCEEDMRKALHELEEMQKTVNTSGRQTNGVWTAEKNTAAE